MTIDEKLKVFFDLFKSQVEIDKVFDVDDDTLFQMGFKTGAEMEEFRKFLSNTINFNLMEILREEFSETEIDRLISFFSNPDFFEVLKHHILLFEQTTLRVDIAVGHFLNQRAIEKIIAKEADKEEKN